MILEKKKVKWSPALNGLVSIAHKVCTVVSDTNTKVSVSQAIASQSQQLVSLLLHRLRPTMIGLKMR